MKTKTSIKKRNFRSNIFKTAWSLLKKGLFSSFAEALHAAWMRFKIRIALKSGLAYFTFRKANGELREAIGTLYKRNFSYLSKGSHRKENLSVVKYWDVVSQGWRSFRIDRLVSIKN